MTDKLAPEYSLIYPVIKKSPMIITTCHTGIGSAKQIQSLLEHSIPTSLHYKIEAVDLEYLKKYGDSNSVFEQYDVKAIVGTSDPHIKRVPYIVPGDLGCGFWPNFSHFIVDLIMQATLFDHNRNWYRKKLKEEVDICQCNRAIHRYHQGLSRSGVH